MSTGQVLGRGISFPPRVGGDGRLAWSQGDENVRDAIEVILQTNLGERLRLPDFGAGLQAFLFEPNTPATHSTLADRITRALATWEPRIALESVDVAADPNDSEAAIATITYKLVATQASASVTLTIGLSG